MKNHEKPTWNHEKPAWVVTGDSQEEVLIFRYTQTNRTFLLYIDFLYECKSSSNRYIIIMMISYVIIFF